MEAAGARGLGVFDQRNDPSGGSILSADVSQQILCSQRFCFVAALIQSQQSCSFRQGCSRAVRNILALQLRQRRARSQRAQPLYLKLNDWGWVSQC